MSSSAVTLQPYSEARLDDLVAFNEGMQPTPSETGITRESIRDLAALPSVLFSVAVSGGSVVGYVVGARVSASTDLSTAAAWSPDAATADGPVVVLLARRFTDHASMSAALSSWMHHLPKGVHSVATLMRSGDDDENVALTTLGFRSVQMLFDDVTFEGQTDWTLMQRKI